MASAHSEDQNIHEVPCTTGSTCRTVKEWLVHLEWSTSNRHMFEQNGSELEPNRHQLRELELLSKAIVEHPGSYKLWCRLLQCHVDITKQKWSVCGVPRETVVQDAMVAFESCLESTFLRRMPMLWLLYMQFLCDLRRITQVRCVLDRALQCLALPQHALIWRFVVEWIRTSPHLPVITTRHLILRYVTTHRIAPDRSTAERIRNVALALCFERGLHHEALEIMESCHSDERDHVAYLGLDYLLKVIQHVSCLVRESGTASAMDTLRAAVGLSGSEVVHQVILPILRSIEDDHEDLVVESNTDRDSKDKVEDSNSRPRTRKGEKKRSGNDSSGVSASPQSCGRKRNRATLYSTVEKILALCIPCGWCDSGREVLVYALEMKCRIPSTFALLFEMYAELEEGTVRNLMCQKPTPSTTEGMTFTFLGSYAKGSMCPWDASTHADCVAHAMERYERVLQRREEWATRVSLRYAPQSIAIWMRYIETLRNESKAVQGGTGSRPQEDLVEQTFVEALRVLQSESDAEDSGRSHEIATVWTAMARFYEEDRNDGQSAIDVHHQALKTAATQGWGRETIAYLWCHLVETYLRANRGMEAIEVLRQLTATNASSRSQTEDDCSHMVDASGTEARSVSHSVRVWNLYLDLLTHFSSPHVQVLEAEPSPTNSRVVRVTREAAVEAYERMIALGIATPQHYLNFVGLLQTVVAETSSTSLRPKPCTRTASVSKQLQYLSLAVQQFPNEIRLWLARAQFVWDRCVATGGDDHPTTLTLAHYLHLLLEDYLSTTESYVSNPAFPSEASISSFGRVFRSPLCLEYHIQLLKLHAEAEIRFGTSDAVLRCTEAVATAYRSYYLYEDYILSSSAQNESVRGANHTVRNAKKKKDVHPAAPLPPDVNFRVTFASVLNSFMWDVKHQLAFRGIPYTRARLEQDVQRLQQELKHSRLQPSPTRFAVCMSAISLFAADLEAHCPDLERARAYLELGTRAMQPIVLDTLQKMESHATTDPKGFSTVRALIQAITTNESKHEISTVKGAIVPVSLLSYYWRIWRVFEAKQAQTIDSIDSEACWKAQSEEEIEEEVKKRLARVVRTWSDLFESHGVSLEEFMECVVQCK